MKKLVALILSAVAAVCCVSLAGCGKTKVPDDTNNKKDVVKFDAWTKDDFLIGTFVAYGNDDEKTPSMREQTKLLADSGVNFITCGNWIPGHGEEMFRDMSTEIWWQYVDKVMKENNMLYTFGADATGPNTNTPNPELVAGTASNMSDAGVEYAKRIVPKLENCMGIMVCDEPSVFAIPQVAEWSKKYVGIKEGVMPFVNLFPEYVGEMYLGGTYEQYLEKWVTSVGAENIEWLSHDYYSFRQNSTEEGIYSNMEAMRKVGLKYDLKTHGFPQSCAWQGMRMPNENELRWNVYAYLAYGFKGLSYFNYLMWGGEGCYDGVIDLNGQIQHKNLYDFMTDMNNDIHYMNDMLMNLDCLHAYHTDDEDGCEKLPANSLIGVEKADDGNDFIVSYMKARDGSEPHIVLFNKSWRFESEAQNFTVGESSGITGIEVWNPETKKYEEVQLSGNKFAMNFKAGEGKYLRLKGNVNMN